MLLQLNVNQSPNDDDDDDDDYDDDDDLKMFKCPTNQIIAFVVH